MDERLSFEERTPAGLHAFLADWIRPLLQPEDPILDLGCGSGAWLRRLAGQGQTRLTGIDQQPAKEPEPFTRLLQDLDQTQPWPLESGSCRLITAIEVIEHLTNIGHFLAECERLLAPEGELVITTPNVAALTTRLRFAVTGELKQFGRLGDATHLFPVITATLPRVLERHGLRTARLTTYPNDGRVVTIRGLTRALLPLLRGLLPDPLPGDSLVLRIRRQ